MRNGKGLDLEVEQINCPSTGLLLGTKLLSSVSVLQKINSFLTPVFTIDLIVSCQSIREPLTLSIARPTAHISSKRSYLTNHSSSWSSLIYINFYICYAPEVNFMSNKSWKQTKRKERGYLYLLKFTNESIKNCHKNWAVRFLYWQTVLFVI